MKRWSQTSMLVSNRKAFVKYFMLTLCLSINALLASGLSFAGMITSSFDTNNEGWFIQDLNQGTLGEEGTFPVGHSMAGGNPGGHIFSSDPGPFGFMFAAPASYLGDQSSALGGVLKFDLLNSIGNPVPLDLVILKGNGVTLRYNGDQPVTPSYTNFMVPLEATSSWQAFASGSNEAAMPGDFSTAFANLSGLYIRGDWVSGGEISRLDNVSLNMAATNAPVPEPSTILLFGTGVAGLVGWRRLTKTK